MSKSSSGLLVYKHFPDGLRFLLVHPSGSYNKTSAYGFPKGIMEKGEEAELTAHRETFEETGIRARTVQYLGSATYKNKLKTIYCFLAEYEEGEILEDFSCPNKDWENDIAKFFTPEEALTLLREELIIFLRKGIHYLESTHG